MKVFKIAAIMLLMLCSVGSVFACTPHIPDIPDEPSCPDCPIISCPTCVDGEDGRDGIDGQDGRDGIDGINGKDGIDGINGKDGQDGKDGIDGINGKDGKDGIDGINGKDGIDGKDGKDGVTTIIHIKDETPSKPVDLTGDGGEKVWTGKRTGLYVQNKVGAEDAPYANLGIVFTTCDEVPANCTTGYGEVSQPVNAWVYNSGTGASSKDLELVVKWENGSIIKTFVNGEIAPGAALDIGLVNMKIGEGMYIQYGYTLSESSAGPVTKFPGSSTSDISAQELRSTSGNRLVQGFQPNVQPSQYVEGAVMASAGDELRARGR